jgi:ubiquinone biosynthesis monooxygenase Coq7
VWKIAATALGWGTAMLGREAAMACTEAVETEIGGHYNAQVRVLLAWVREMEQAGEEVGEEIRGLVETLKRIRDEELEHLDTAVGEDAKRAPGYEMLNRVVRGGCKGAIWLSERI